MGDGTELEYVIATVEVSDPDKLQKLDTKNSSREKDGATVKMPSQTNVCAIQLWEVYVCAAILIVQPHSSVLFAHVKALCEHNEPKHLCECILKEHTCVGNVTDTSQDMSLYTFLDEYLHRKFSVTFVKNSILKYVLEVLDDPLCGKDGIPRVFLLAPHLQAFLLNSQYFEAQYDELFNGMQVVNLPVSDVLNDGEYEIGEALDIQWDNVKLYDDPNLILKKYGGWASTRTTKMLTPKDQLTLRLTGCTLEQLLAGLEVPDSPRHPLEEDVVGQAAAAAGRRMTSKERQATKRRTSTQLGSGQELTRKDSKEEEGDSDSSHPSDFEVNAEHPKVAPLGVTLCEMYLLLRGLHVGGQAFSRDWQGSVVGQQMARSTRDGHVLAAAVLMDLYMREQIDVHHWTLAEGNIAVAYRAQRKKAIGLMDHFLDDYVHDVEEIFKDMRLPHDIAEGPIWASLEERGVVDNHRPSWERAFGCGYMKVDVWDLARPDLLLDLKEGYLTAARVMYDKEFPDPLDEEANDVLMFCYLIQHLFDCSLEAKDGMAKVLNRLCPPFHKGELFPPVLAVHSSAVCLGLADRASRFAHGRDATLADEAAEFNQVVMERLEKTFFLSPKVWESFDADHSGELSMDEFVEGMRKIDVYKDFRKERVPDGVLRMIVTDLAERLFQEVDINMDGTLTIQELQIAFKRRRNEALAQRASRQFVRRAADNVAVQMGFKKDKKSFDDPRAEAKRLCDEERQRALKAERRQKGEWESEVDRPELLDADVDVDTAFATYR